MSELAMTGAGTTARGYHEATKHSYESVREHRFALDWANKPHPFKEYEGMERVALPTGWPRFGVPAIQALDGIVHGPQPLHLPKLARLLTLGAGVRRRMGAPGGEELFFRTYASAGALYPIEVYVATGELPGLAAGLYHFDPKGFSLGRLRDGDQRGHLVRAAEVEPAVAHAEAVVVLTGIPWRTAWKYGDRGYRHLFWDAGMVAANVLALAASSGLPARVVAGFVDRDVEALLGLDGEREFPICLIAIGTGARVAPAPLEPGPGDVPADAYRPAYHESIPFAVRPLSHREVPHPAIREANDAARLAGARDVEDWRMSPRKVRSAPEGNEHGEPVRPERHPYPAVDVDTAIRRRGSARRFARTSMPAGVLASILDRATGGIPTDYAPDGSTLTEAYVVANAVDGLDAGAYVYEDESFRLLHPGEFRRRAGYLALEQRLAADAAATHFLMSDLEAAFERHGDRGYRVAQLEGGIVAGRIYLGAYAYGYGATGLTFYDDEVTQFFWPDARGKSCMLVTSVGESPGRRSLRPIP